MFFFGFLVFCFLCIIFVLIFLYILFLLGFPVFCFLYIIFVLIFLCILFLLDFLVFALVFPCIAHLFILCVFWFLQFCQSSSSLFRHSPSIAEPFSAPPPLRASNASFSVRGLLARDRFYFPVFYYFFSCNKFCLDRLAFECDAWSRSLGYKYEHYPDFQVEEDKCWSRILSPQCQGIIDTYALVDSV